ncbi:MAG: hypothetical protein AAFX76_07890 [Planctomycetota bacterium]
MSESAEENTSTAPAGAPTLSDYLAFHEVPCPACGYNLHALRGDTCPECGVSLTLRVGLLKPKLLGLMMSLTACSLAAGIGAFFLGGNWAAGSFAYFFDNLTLAAWSCVAMVVLGTSFLILVISRRNKVVGMNRRGQHLLAWIPTVVTVAWIGYLMRVIAMN